LAGIAADSLHQYYSTVNQTNNAGQTPWSPDTTLWPQILSLAFAIVLIILSTTVLFAYIRGADTADQMDDWRNKFLTYFPLFLDHLHTLFPMSVTISMFATSASSNGLQFQGCANNPPAFPNINFSGICIMQVSALHCPRGVDCRGLFNICLLFTLRWDTWLD
jgi:hypothetical protein